MTRTHFTTSLRLFGSLLCLLSSVLVSSVNAQATPKSTTADHGHSIPLDHLYWHFLEYQLYLDKKADALPPTHPDVQVLRTHYQRRLGFDDSQYDVVRRAAQIMSTRLQQKDDQAKSIIDAFHKNYPPGKVLTLPPPPAELVQLQAEREAIISGAVSDLKAQLGATASAKMDNFLHEDFAPSVTFRSMRPAGPPNRSKASLGQVFTAVKP